MNQKRYRPGPIGVFGHINRTIEKLKADNLKLQKEINELKEEIQRLKWAATAHD